MLARLKINGLAIIDQLSIDFSRGFNVITGETGAGKSILIKALGLLLGVKASAEVVRQGASQAEVEGHFQIEDGHPAYRLISQMNIARPEAGAIFKINIKRVIHHKGRSQAWVNETPVTTGDLKLLASCLLDVFGQHDTHRLIDSQFQAACLDQFIKSRDLLSDYSQRYGKASVLLRELRLLVDQVQGKGPDQDYLQFRLKEIQEFAPSVEDFENVQSVTNQIKNLSQITKTMTRAQELLTDEHGICVSSRLFEVAKILQQPKTIDSNAMVEQALDLAQGVEDLSLKIGQILPDVDFSEEDIDKAEGRLAGYQNLFRKHHVPDVTCLVALAEKLHQQLEAVSHSAFHIKEILLQLRNVTADLIKMASLITDHRQIAAKKVIEKVELELAELSMPSARFNVEFLPFQKAVPAIDLSSYGDEVVSLWSEILDDWCTLGEFGLESVEFQLAANKGEPLRPLAKVASGGEMSRIMLALKKSFAVGSETCVLVFDEIDTGISGRVADHVGHKIADLAHYCQIICISHLPQVAVYADQHYCVKKFELKGRTESTIILLNDKERCEEIAKLLSGDKVTLSSIDHAKDLVQSARKKSEKRVSTGKRQDEKR